MREESLRRRRDFRHLYEEGVSHRERDVVLVVRANGMPIGRIAVVASRKVGGAVERNRAKRLMREAHRRLRPPGGFKGFDLALIARAGLPERNTPAIERQMSDLYRRAGLIRDRIAAQPGENSDFSE